MKRIAAWLVLAWLALIAGPAVAQQGVTLQPFTPTAGTSGQPVTNVSARTALPNADPHLLVVNGGSNAVHYKLGDGSVTATTSDPVLEPMAAMPVAVGTNTNIAYLTETSTSTLYLIQGTGGPPNQFIGSSGSGGGSGTSSSFGAAFPATGTAIGAKNGANMVNLTADASSNLNINCASGCGVSSFSDQGTFTFGSTSINTIGGVYSANPTPLTSGTAGAALLTQGRILETASFASNGVEIGATLRSGFSPPLQVNQSPLLAIAKLVPPLNAISDGKNIASFAGPNTVVDGSKPSLVTALSPNSPLPAGTNALGSVTVTGTSTVSGTVTANQGTSPWVGNITQFGSSNVATGTGASGAGIPRVTISNDSSLAANQSTNVAQFGGSAIATGTGTGGAGIPRVTVSSDSTVTANAGSGTFTTSDNHLPAAGALSDALGNPSTTEIGANLLGWDATNTVWRRVQVTAATGKLLVDNSTVTQPVSGTVAATQSGNWTSRIVGNAGGIMDAAGQNASSPANELIVGCQFNTTPTTITSGNVSPVQCDNGGKVLVNTGTVTVTGTVTTTPPSNASTNVAQFGGTNVSTGTGAGGAGIPRVTISNDSSLAANQSVNVNQISGAAVSTAASGVQKVGVTGNTGAALDAAGQNVASPANELLVGAQFNTTPTTLTNGNMSPLQLDNAGNLLVNLKANSFGTVTVAGTVTTTPPSNASTNVAQFGGTNVSTGTGAAGAGIPRVTISNDSSLAANQSVNVNQISGAAVSTAASGTQKVGVTGNTGAAMDAAGQNVASPANELLTGCQFNTSPTTITSGNMSPVQCDNAGKVLVNPGTVTVTGTVTTTPPSNASTNVAQFGGTNVSTGTGASGTGIPRVTVANDSNVLATQSGTWTVQPGNTANTTPWLVTARIVGNAGAIIDFAGQNASSPANAVLTGAQFNTSPTALSSGNVSPLQMDSSANLLVNCKTGCGASSFNDTQAFTFGSTAINVMGGVYSSAPTPLASGQAGAPLLTQGRTLETTNFNSSGIEVGNLLPGKFSPPLQVNQTGALINRQTIFSLNNSIPALDNYGQQRVAAWLTDGNDYVSVTSRGKPPKTMDSALVTSNGLVPALMCPFIAAVSQTANTKVVAGQAGKFIHVCSYKVVSATAQSVALIEGTGTTCGTGTGNLDGQTTSGSIALAANGGFQTGTGTTQVVIPMQKGGDDLCIAQSAAGNVSGYVNYGIFN